MTTVQKLIEALQKCDASKEESVAIVNGRNKVKISVLCP